MARPRKGVDVRKSISLRLDPRVVEQNDERAKRAGETRTAYVERKLTETFRPPDPRPLIDVLADMDPADVQAAAAVLDPIPACPHPRKALTVRPYMTVCDADKGGCGERLR